MSGMLTEEEAKRIEAKFWSMAIPEPMSGCLLWFGTERVNGYGGFHVGRGRWVLAHRLAYWLHYRVEMGSLCVCHKCDNGWCVNPQHLFLGTRGDNNADRDRKGRAVHMRGAATGHAKLTPEQVRDIRRRYQHGPTADRLAKEFGVSRATIYHVHRRWKWAYVEDEC